MKKDNMTDMVMGEVSFLRKLTPSQRDLYGQYLEAGKKLIRDPEGLKELLNIYSEKEKRDAR